MKTPLLLRIDCSKEGRQLEFLLGKTTEELEKVGKLEVHGVMCIISKQYTAFKTEKINSFYTMKSIFGINQRKMYPGETIMLRPGERIGCGYDKQIFSIPVLYTATR